MLALEVFEKWYNYANDWEIINKYLSDPVDFYEAKIFGLKESNNDPFKKLNILMNF